MGMMGFDGNDGFDVNYGIHGNDGFWWEWQYTAAQVLEGMGFDTLPVMLVDDAVEAVDETKIAEWFRDQRLDLATGGVAKRVHSNTMPMPRCLAYQ